MGEFKLDEIGYRCLLTTMVEEWVTDNDRRMGDLEAFAT